MTIFWLLYIFVSSSIAQSWPLSPCPMFSSLSFSVLFFLFLSLHLSPSLSFISPPLPLYSYLLLSHYDLLVQTTRIPYVDDTASSLVSLFLSLIPSVYSPDEEPEWSLDHNPDHLSSWLKSLTCLSSHSEQRKTFATSPPPASGSALEAPMLALEAPQLALWPLSPSYWAPGTLKSLLFSRLAGTSLPWAPGLISPFSAFYLCICL